MKHLLPILALIALLPSLSAAEPEWSDSMNGLKARLSLERQPDSPFLKIFIEFQAASDVGGIMKVRFSPEALAPQVTDEHGEQLKPANADYSGLAPRWEPFTIPSEGTLKFRISYPGMGHNPAQDRTIIDLGPRNCWIIPADQPHFLQTTLTIPREKGDHPSSDWSGTLNLPKIPIPAE